MTERYGVEQHRLSLFQFASDGMIVPTALLSDMFDPSARSIWETIR